MIVVGTFAYLVFMSVTLTSEPYIKLSAEIDWTGARKVQDQYIIPVKIENLGHRTPSKAIFAVEHEGKKIAELSIDYLARKSTQTVYLTLQQKLDVKIRIEQYQF